MSNAVIQATNLYKEYKIGVINHGTLLKDVQSWWAKRKGREDPNSIISSHHSDYSERNSILSLCNVSFEVNRSEVVGIVGRNGAGKSTLLRILARTTAPTKGAVGIKGQIGSLLDIGTGFHPELTGMENIFLNGAILGMLKNDVKEKVDDIIDYSELEKFMNTPVKRYSSGMYVRLAFSIAVNLKTDILLIDEILAVGDLQFKQKCYERMKEISDGGKTIILVSHTMDIIQKLCNRVMLLDQGELINYDVPSVVIPQYLNILQAR